MTYLLSVGVSAWNLHAHRYYRVSRSRPMRSWSVGPIRVVVTSYQVVAGEALRRLTEIRTQPDGADEAALIREMAERS